jgi:hypothetical protein
MGRPKGECPCGTGTTLEVTRADAVDPGTETSVVEVAAANAPGEERDARVSKFNHNINRPRPHLRGMGAAACIVLGVSGCHVRGEPRVVLGRTLVVPEDVHERFSTGVH